MNGQYFLRVGLPEGDDDIAQGYREPVLDFSLLVRRDKTPVDGDPIGAVEVFDINLALSPRDSGMPSGNRRIVDLDIVPGRPPQMKDISFNLKNLTFIRSVDDEQFQHDPSPVTGK